MVPETTQLKPRNKEESRLFDQWLSENRRSSESQTAIQSQWPEMLGSYSGME